MYDPPASRFARRVPLLLTQKGEGWRCLLHVISHDPALFLVMNCDGCRDVSRNVPTGIPLSPLRSAKGEIPRCARNDIG